MTAARSANLSLVPREPDNLIRLSAFRREHPEVRVGADEYHHWQAVIPEPSGETAIIRHTLAELLAKLAEFFHPADEITRLYREGLTEKQVADKTGRSVPDVRRVLRGAGIKPRPGRRPPLSEQEAEAVVKACTTGGMTFAAAARKWGISVKAIRTLLAVRQPPSPQDDGGLLRAGEAARVAGISPKRLSRLACEEKVPFARVAPTSNRLYRRSDMEALAGRINVPPPEPGGG